MGDSIIRMYLLYCGLCFSQRCFNSFFPPIKLDQGPWSESWVPPKISRLFMQENRESPRDQGGHYKFQIGVANRIFLKPFWPLGLDGLMAVGL